MPAVTQGIHHLGLTVSDIHLSAAFFIEVFGFDIVGEKPDYPAIFISDGEVMLTLWQVDRETCVAFDRKSNIGLHHFALKVANHDQLNKLYEICKAHISVTVEFPPEPLGSSPLRHMMCQIPGGIRLELISSEALS